MAHTCSHSHTCVTCTCLHFTQIHYIYTHKEERLDNSWRCNSVAEHYPACQDLGSHPSMGGKARQIVCTTIWHKHTHPFELKSYSASSISFCPKILMTRLYFKIVNKLARNERNVSLIKSNVGGEYKPWQVPEADSFHYRAFVWRDRKKSPRQTHMQSHNLLRTRKEQTFKPGMNSCCQQAWNTHKPTT